MAQVGRIEAKIQIEQVFLSFQRSIFAFHHPLIGCSGGIILANDLVANVLFVDEFENRLKEVDIEAQVCVDALQKSVLLVAFQSVIANDMTYHRPVLLLDMGLIVFLVRTGTRESNLLVPAIAQEQVVNEFAAVIRVTAQQIKGQILAHGVNCGANCLLATSGQGHWLGPACAQGSTGQGVQKMCCDAVSTMRHQVYFQEAWFVFAPVRKDANRDVLFEQAARLGGTQTLRFVEARRRKRSESVCRKECRSRWSPY